MCDFALNSVQEVSELILNKSGTRTAFSLVRLGDGEGLFLSITNQSPDTDFDYMAGHLGSAAYDVTGLLRLKDRLINTIQSADLIGVRDDIVNVEFEPGELKLPAGEFLDRFRSRFWLRDVEKCLGYGGSRRIALLHRHLGNLDLCDDTLFCSSWVHYGLLKSGAIYGLLNDQKRIGLISCRSKLRSLLESIFKLSVKYVEIPDMYRDLKGSDVSDDYIARLEGVLELNLVDTPGMIYLVGGGLYGKLYCEHIKSQGGIALDVGSLLDAWLGIPSRPAVYPSLCGSNHSRNKVPSEMLLTAENVRMALSKRITR
jgi:hypothetical protein